MALQPRTRVALYCLFTLPLMGCGGGGGGGDDPPAPPNAPGGIVQGDTFAITSANRLVSFNSATPANSSVAAITGLRAGENIVGFDLRPGGMPAAQLIALGNQGGLYTIDPNSATATLKTTLAADPSDTTDRYSSLDGTRVSIDVNNLVDALRIVSNSGQNLRVNMDTGATFTDTMLTVGGINASGITEVAYTNNFTSTCRTTPYYIDSTADRLMTSANASGGVLTPIGPLTVDAAAMTGFDISTGPDGVNSAVAALTVAGVTSLYTIDLTTGAATLVGPIGNLNGGESILGLARPVPATTPPQPLGELLALTDNNSLISFNSGLPQALCSSASINGLQGNETVLSIDMRPADNNVYALTDAGRLYTVNAATGTVAFRATLSASANDPFTGLDGSNITVDVSPVADGLRVLSSNGMNLRVLFTTGEVFTDTPLTAGSSVTAAAYTNSFAGTGTSTLYVIDTQSDRLLIQGRTSGSPNNGDLLDVGALNIGDVRAMAGFDINAVNNTAFAAFNVGTGNATDLYRINLGSGAATRMGTIGGPNRIRALTHSSVPQATLLGLTRDGRLVSFKVTSPGTLDSSMFLNGLQGGEQVLGFDIRPSNGLMYLLTDAGRLYTVDPATARARLGATLMPNTGDPFQRLIGTTFGTDFSPTADALRVLSDAEHNLAVLVDSGATITAQFLRRRDDPNRPAPDVVAIAYTSNFAGTTDTTLFNVDLGINSLVSQKPANDGLLTTIGPLSTTQTFAFSGGFDIVGGDDGLAVAALQPTGSTQSTLYRVNLRSGALMPIGAIGPAGTQPLMGLTVQLR
ncbi:DUF4394 domain-containing protein [Steroidobacter sp. S1-65]|uniref:DUF4394 domain-containing protein n=1 Tax=Steroidobacter gossypii TaxID=2805490 RepID=A0ABS1X302_9GAMM|nr:DUF4394 domain-containing protein [Steroidobacter gossypii]MBM0107600.1 DUF4394 domain-containing protein [Steroidobacter gossypii]